MKLTKQQIDRIIETAPHSFVVALLQARKNGGIISLDTKEHGPVRLGVVTLEKKYGKIKALPVV